MTQLAQRTLGRLNGLIATGAAMADLAEGELPEEAHLVRMIGCPDTRQFEVLELGYHLYVREVPTVQTPMPGPMVGRLWVGEVLKALAVDVLKANDA